jgi:hypothetical protein
MAPPITSKQLELLNTEFYTNLQFFGRDKLYIIMKEKYADHPSRRQIAEISCITKVRKNQKI